MSTESLHGGTDRRTVRPRGRQEAVRIVLHTDRVLKLGTPVTRLNALADLMIVADEGPSGEGLRLLRPYKRELASGRAHVYRISFTSPLELVLSLAAGATALLALAERWAQVRMKLAKSEKEVSKDNLVAAAAKLVLAELRVAGSLVDIKDVELRDRVLQLAITVSEVEKIERVEQSQLEK